MKPFTVADLALSNVNDILDEMAYGGHGPVPLLGLKALADLSKTVFEFVRGLAEIANVSNAEMFSQLSNYHEMAVLFDKINRQAKENEEDALAEAL